MGGTERTFFAGGVDMALSFMFGDCLRIGQKENCLALGETGTQAGFLPKDWPIRLSAPSWRHAWVQSSHGLPVRGAHVHVLHSNARCIAMFMLIVLILVGMLVMIVPGFLAVVVIMIFMVGVTHS